MDTAKFFFLVLSLAIITSVSVLLGVIQLGEDMQESIEVKEEELELQEERITELKELRKSLDELKEYKEEVEKDNEVLKDLLEGGD